MAQPELATSSVTPGFPIMPRQSGPGGHKKKIVHVRAGLSSPRVYAVDRAPPFSLALPLLLAKLRNVDVFVDAHFPCHLPQDAAAPEESATNSS